MKMWFCLPHVILAMALGSNAETLLPYAKSVIPTGQAGPIFVISETSLSAKADQVTLQTLSGQLARYSPRIYTIKSANASLTPESINDDTTVFWLHDLAEHHNILFNFTYLHNPRGLLRLFAHNISAYVLYDPTTLSTNAALIRCAAEKGVIAAGTPSMVAFLSNTLGKPMLANLTTSTPLEEFKHSKHRLSKRGMIAQPDDGGKSNCLSEYAVFARLPTMEHNTDPGKGKMEAFEAALNNFEQTQLNAAFGWTSSDEHAFTASVTQAGGMVHASDFAYNLAVLSQLPKPQTPTPSQLQRTSLSTTIPMQLSPQASRSVHTVAIVNSDGDNIQLLQNDWVSRTHWNHPLRGRQPAGWSYSPAMAQLMPSVLAYAHRTSTVNDSLSTGPSGAGYAYPQLFDPRRRQLFAKATAQLMRESNMTLANVIGVVPSYESVEALALESQVAAIVYFTFGVADQGYSGLHGNVAYVHGTPVVGLRKNLWGDGKTGDKLTPSALVRELQLLPKDPTDPQSYTLVVNELGNNYSEIVQTAQLLAADKGFDLVLPEELVRRLVTATGAKQQCPMPTGSWAEEVGVLPKCWLPGDGTCVLSCDHLHLLPIPVRCDLSVCSNLSMPASKRHFVCADTGKICPGTR